MAGDQETPLRLLLPAPVRRLPPDLAAVAALVAVTNIAVFFPGINQTPLRVLLGLPLVLFLPGYAFVAALFPEAGATPASADHDDNPARTDEQGEPVVATDGSTAAPPRTTPDESSIDREGGIDGIERVALSFGLSIAIVPLLGLVLNFTPWGIRLTPVMIAVSGFTLAAVAVAAQRRRALPPAERFSVPYRAWIATTRDELLEPDDGTDLGLNVLLVASILLAVGSVGYAVAVPPQGEQFSEFYLLTEDDDGDLVADGYPETFVAGEPRPLVVGIGNQEQRSTQYTVVVEAHDVELLDGGNETRIRDRERLLTRTTTIEHNETRNFEVRPAPTMTGEELRLTFLLYRGAASEIPARPDPDGAYRSVHLWIDVGETEP